MAKKAWIIGIFIDVLGCGELLLDKSILLLKIQDIRRNCPNGRSFNDIRRKQNQMLSGVGFVTFILLWGIRKP